MKVAIIADDLTGANDSGVQLATYGLRTSVLLDKNHDSLEKSDVVIFDTDSRSIQKEEAYTRVKEVSEFLRQKQFDVIYKKIDSSMRGNVGAEINAVYEVFRPDFVIIAPAFPKSEREVINGFHYLHHRLLHETEVASDPKTPVTESFLPKLLKEQTNQNIGHISLKELHQGATNIHNRLRGFRKQNTRYILFDSRDEEDLKQVVNITRQMDAFVIWVGSAGLAAHLPESFGLQRNERALHLEKEHLPILVVMGSVSRVGRQQLKEVLSSPGVIGVPMRSELVISESKSRDIEMQRVYEEVSKAAQSGAQVIALYSSGEPEDIELAMQAGEQIGLAHTGVSDRISRYLGEISYRLIQQYSINRVVLTGGDTAKQVFKQLGASEFVLVDEVEPGVPVGYVVGQKSFYAVTKAGSFGSTAALSNAMNKLLS